MRHLADVSIINIHSLKTNLFMKSKDIFLFSFAAYLFVGCKNETSLKDKAEKFVRDSVVTSFNDPKSFELVSTTIDTFKTKDALKNTQDFLKYASDKVDSAKQLKKIDSLKLLNQDAMINYELTISYRAKNKMGALMLDNMLLFYHPENNRFEVVRLQEKQ